MGTPKCGQMHHIRSEPNCPECIQIRLWERLILANERANDLKEIDLYGEKQPRKEPVRYQESTYKPPEPQVPQVVRRTQ